SACAAAPAPRSPQPTRPTVSVSFRPAAETTAGNPVEETVAAPTAAEADVRRNSRREVLESSEAVCTLSSVSGTALLLFRKELAIKLQRLRQFGIQRRHGQSNAHAAIVSGRQVLAE